jgi:hypothetical protein
MTEKNQFFTNLIFISAYSFPSHQPAEIVTLNLKGLCTILNNR